MKGPIKLSLSTILVLICAFVLLAPAVFASDGTAAVVTVIGAQVPSITVPTVGDFSRIMLDGTDQQAKATLSAFTVTDATGTGKGWQVSVVATPFKGDGGHVLEKGSLTLDAPKASSVGSSSGAPTSSARSFVLDGGQAVPISTAAKGTGMGKYDFGATQLTLKIPASAYADTYRSTITFSITAAP